MRRLMTGWLALSTALGAHALERAKKIEIQGHRGARWVRPENTLPAFKYALDVGVDTLEMDTLVTKDGHVVVTHDPTLNPDICLDKSGKKIKSGIAIRSLTLTELKSYDCGSLINPRFKQQTPVPKTAVPTLDEVFEMVAAHPAGKRVLFNIETKSDEEHPEYAPAPAEFVDKLLAVLRKHAVMARVTLQSFDYRTLRAAHEKDPGLGLSVLIYSRPKKGLLELAKEYKARIVSPNFSWLRAEDIAELHGAGIRVIPWTVNDAADWSRLISLGVDGIITDNPKELVGKIGERSM